jgi:hypothetical protein
MSDLASTAVLGFSLLGVAVPLGFWTLWLLQATLVFIGAGMRYHCVLRSARPPSGLTIQDFYTLGRTYHTGLDMSLAIFILEV